MPHLRSQSNRSSAFSSSPVDLGPRSRGRSWTLLLNRLGPAGEIIGQPRPSSHLRTLAGDRQRPYGSSAEVMERLWSPAVATGGKWDGREDGSNKRKPLPWVATSCRDPKMVRRGSTVRVRQRALQSPSKSGVSHRTLYRANKVLLLLGFPHEDLQSQRRRVGSHGRARGLALQGRLGRRAHRRRADRRE